MITGATKSYDPEAIKKSRKDYYLLTVNHRYEGICTSRENALSCISKYAKKYGANKLSDEVYSYSDNEGLHLITIEPIKRIKISGNEE